MSREMWAMQQEAISQFGNILASTFPPGGAQSNGSPALYLPIEVWHTISSCCLTIHSATQL